MWLHGGKQNFEVNNQNTVLVEEEVWEDKVKDGLISWTVQNLKVQALYDVKLCQMINSYRSFDRL